MTSDPSEYAVLYMHVREGTYSYVDLSRVCIWGWSGAGNAIFFRGFPMFVPSLCWQNDRCSYINCSIMAAFFAGGGSNTLNAM